MILDSTVTDKGVSNSMYLSIKTSKLFLLEESIFI